MSYISFSQTATKTVQVPKDSIVVLPTKLVTYMVQDLVRYDGLKAQMVTMNSNVELYKKQIDTQETQNNELRRKLNASQATVTEYQTIDEANQRTIEALKTKSGKIKRQRNVFIYFSAALIVGIITK